MMVKTYLEFQGEVVAVELDVHELCSHINIQEGQYVTKVEDVLAPPQAVMHFLSETSRIYIIVRLTLPIIRY